MPSWLTSTASKPRSSLDGDEIIRLVDDPNGTPTTGSTTIDALKAYASNVLDVVSFGAQPTDRDGVPTVDSAPAINEALAAGEFRTVFVPNGAYLLGSRLHIGRGTRLVCETPEGVIFYKGHTGTMVANDLGYEVGSDIEPYSGNGGIVIDGGVWDGFTNNPTGFDAYTHFALGFATNLVVKNATFLNSIHGGHAIDLSCSKHVLIEDCKFLGHALNGGDFAGADCIQLDASTGDLGGPSDSFPHFGSAKKKLCEDVTIRRCKFGPNPDQADVRFTTHQLGISSHASVWGQWQTRIVVDECEFDGLQHSGVRIWKWRDVTVTRCRFLDCRIPIYVQATSAGGVSSIDTNGVQQNSSDGSVDGLYVSDNDFIRSTDYDLYLRDYSYGAGATTAKHKHIKWHGNRSQGSTGANGTIAIRYCEDSEFIGNTIADCVKWFHCSVLATSSGIKIANNRLLRASITTVGDGGIYMSGVALFEIIGNTIDTCGTRGIFIEDESSHGLIASNTFRALGGAAAYIQGASTDILVESNKVGATCLTHDEAAFRVTSTSARNTIRGGHYDYTVPPAYMTGSTGGHIDVPYNATPEGAIVAPIGSRVTVAQGGPGASVWIKEFGSGTATGWTAQGAGARPLYRRATGWPHTGDTTKTTVLTLTGIVPAGAMGPSGRLEISVQSSAAANNANVKTVQLQINDGTGAVTVLQQLLANQRSMTTRLLLTNRDATNVQMAQGLTQASSFAASTVALASYAIDTTQALTITGTIELASASDTVTIEMVEVNVIYGA